VRTVTIASVVAIVTVLTVQALLPGPAAAKPGHYKVPPGHVLQMTAHGTHGYEILIQVNDGRAQLSAVAQSGSGDSFVLYEQSQKRDVGDDLDADFGPAGKLRARFVPRKVEEVKPPKGCVGGTTVDEIGYFVGSFSFHGAHAFTSFNAHRLAGAVTRYRRLVCRGPNPADRHPVGDEGERELRVIAGTPSGATFFDAVTEPAEGIFPSTSTYSVQSERKEGSVSILDSVRASASSPLAIPDLTASLPATATIAPPAPFSGSATLEAPSRQTATWSGDLAVDLPATGEVPLTGPGIAAGLCDRYACTGSLPQALRPHRPKYGLAVEIQTIR
jgi:hypothetical protein